MLKWIGACLVFIGCGGFGFATAAVYKREIRSLRNLLRVLDYIECELQYRQLPLAELCRRASTACTGCVSSVMNGIAQELDNQILPDVAGCIKAAITKRKDIPVYTMRAFQNLEGCLGAFDTETQLKALAAVRQECRFELDTLAKNQHNRVHSYQVLGVCAGAAVAILFL